ncbi:MAG: hypothetical protein IKC01_01155 [Clostridia bacterium]|nr:hypothetical protein [Clostridia bacterium]
MIVKVEGYIFDVDIESSKAYSQEHSLCQCDEDRNFYVQARKEFPKLSTLLEKFGIMIDRPDEIRSIAMDGYIDYNFVSYTVVGEIKEASGYEIDLFDGEHFLNIAINDIGVPNEQKTDRYFTITVYNIQLPWVLDEPFPQSASLHRFSVFGKLKELFSKNRD